MSVANVLSRCLPLAAGGLLLVAASLHAAPPKPREGTLGGGKAGGPIMSSREAAGVKYGLHRANFKAPAELKLLKLKVKP